MVRYEHLPIYARAMELAVYLQTVVRNFSRYDKYTIVREICPMNIIRVFVMAVLMGYAGSLHAALIDNGDGTVTDTNTGLMWQQQDDDVTRTWENALTYCEDATLAGYDDWRLPTIKELDSIVDLARYNPAIDPVFSGTNFAHYWSSTNFANNTSYAWSMYLSQGYDDSSYKSNAYYVRAVRGGQIRSLGNLVILAPQQGAEWETNTTQTILWETQGITGNVSITLSRDGGKTFSETLSVSTANDGSFEWNVGGELSYNCVLKITPLDDVDKAATQGLFTIYAPPLLSGTVTDLGTGLPMSEVSVAADTGTTTTTNSSGFYDFFLGSGTYDITYSKDGYQTVILEDVILAEGNPIVIDVQMTPPGPLYIIPTTLPPAEVGEAYEDRVLITGGIFPYIFSIDSGSLPPGLTIDPDSGIITGTPTTPGTDSFFVAVTDAELSYAGRWFPIEVTQPLTITTSSPLPRGTRTKSYSYSFSATGGSGSYSYSRISGTIPSGLSLSSAGLLSGTPSAAGSYDFTVRVTDDSARTDDKDFHMNVDNPLTISTSTMNDGIVGTEYSQTLSASGGYGDYTWRLYAGQIPTGLMLDGIAGTIAGTPSIATYNTFVVSVSDEYGRVTYKDLSVRVCDPFDILTSALPDGLINEPYSEAIQTKGGFGPYTFSYTGYLPDGLSLDSTTGIISGTPTEAVYTNMIITVTDSTSPGSQSDTQSLSLNVTPNLTILTSAVLPNAKMGVTISPIVLSAGGGPSPYTWQLVDGYMPEGITLNTSTGELSGTPLDKGDFVFTIQVTDANTTTAEKEFLWHISGELSITTGAVADGAQGESYSFMLEAEGGIKPYTWSFINGTLPSGLSINPSTGAIYGTPTTRASYTFTVRVTDSDAPAQTDEREYSIEVVDELLIFTQSVPNGRIDEAYTATVSAKLGLPPYSWRLESGVLPPGITLTSSSTVATLDGTPTTAGTYEFTLEVSDVGTPTAYDTKTYTVEIYDDVVIETNFLRCATRNVAYSQSILTSGGKVPYRYEIIAGSLPLGLALNSTSGQITGITAEVGGFSTVFTLRVIDAGNPSDYDDKEFSLFVIDQLEITTDALPGAAIGYPYQTTLEGEGGISPPQWYVHSGQLPPGLSLDIDTGEISGTPLESTCGTYDFTIRLEDASPQPETVTKAFSIEVIAINDNDCDGLSNILENSIPCLDANDADTDDDGILDGAEDADHDGNFGLADNETSPCDVDTDQDGIQDGTEFGLTLSDIGADTDQGVFVYDADPSTTTDPLDADSDNDGLLDGEEDIDGNGRVDEGESDPSRRPVKALPFIPLLLLSD